MHKKTFIIFKKNTAEQTTMRHCYAVIIHLSKPANCSCEWVYLPLSIVDAAYDGMAPSSSALDADHANPN